MRLARRTSLLLALLATLALAAGAAGCGGDDDGGEEANVPEITVPAGEPQTVPEETTTAPETTTTPPDSGGGGGGGGGGNADPSKPDSPTNDIPPEPGTPQAKFEQFCEENPGACG
jgi:hypothetical protein